MSENKYLLFYENGLVFNMLETLEVFILPDVCNSAVIH